MDKKVCNAVKPKEQTVVDKAARGGETVLKHLENM